MRLDWLIPPASERRLLGGAALSGPTPWVIAIMSFSMMIVAAAGLALASTAGLVAASAQHRYSAQVPDGGRALKAVLHQLRADPQVRSADPVPEAEMRRTLEQWLGAAADNRDLPIPALVHFDLAPGADVNLVARRIAAVDPSAKVMSHKASLAPLLSSLRAMQWLALGLVLLLAAATTAAVVLAARGALDTHRFTIEVMHGIGATDVQVTRLFQRKIAIDSLVGSVAGAAAAALALALLIFASGGFISELTGGLTLGVPHMIALLVLPLALAALATLVGRAAVLAALRRSL